MDESELGRMIEDIFADFAKELPYDCGFDPNDSDEDKKWFVDSVRSQILRHIFLSGDFTTLLAKSAEFVMHVQIQHRWDEGESINKGQVLDLNHICTHVARDLLQRFYTQAVEPFVLAMHSEGRYVRNAEQHSKDFEVLKNVD